MSKPSYWELLKHPKWQEKRLVIMQQANFECENCGDKSTTLNVHHSYYEKGASPWEYPDDSLQCLCEPCHKKAEVVRLQLNRLLGPLSLHHAEEIIGMLIGLKMEHEDESADYEADGYERLSGMVRMAAKGSGYKHDHRVNCLITHPLFDGHVVNRELLDDAIEKAKGTENWPYGAAHDKEWQRENAIRETYELHQACTG